MPFTETIETIILSNENINKRLSKFLTGGVMPSADNDILKMKSILADCGMMTGANGLLLAALVEDLVVSDRTPDRDYTDDPNTYK